MGHSTAQNFAKDKSHFDFWIQFFVIIIIDTVIRCDESKYRWRSTKEAWENTLEITQQHVKHGVQIGKLQAFNKTKARGNICCLNFLIDLYHRECR